MRCLSVVTAAALVLIAGEVFAQQILYDVQVLVRDRLRPNKITTANDVNAKGIVVGNDANSRVAFRVSAEGDVQLLPGLAGGVASTRAAAINEAGTAVGSSISELGRRAVVFPRGGGVRDLGAQLPEAAFSEATAISGAGHVAGYFSLQPDGSDPDSFVWDRVNGIKRATAPSKAYGVNNQGMVVGQFIGILGFYWMPNDVLRAISGTVDALAVNDLGQVVGSADRFGKNSGAYVWQASTGVVDLPALPGFEAACTARDINNAGVIVGDCIGTSRLGGTKGPRAVVWNPVDGGYVVTALRSLLDPADDRRYFCPRFAAGYVLDEARAISDDGKIAVSIICQEQGYLVDTDPLLLIPRSR